MMIKNATIQQNLGFTGNVEAMKGNSATALKKKEASDFVPNRPVIDESNFVSARYVSKNGVLMEDTEENRLFQGLNDVASDFGGSLAYTDRQPDTDVMSKFADEYSRIRDSIKENYTGDRQTELLGALDKRYDEQVKDAATAMQMELNSVAMIHKIRATITAAHQQYADGKNSSVYEAAKAKAKSEADGMTAVAKTLHDSMIQMGKNAKEFILSGNKSPKTAAEKAAFNQYISKGAEINHEGFSAIAGYTKAMSNGIESAKNFQDTMSNLMSSDLSGSIKELLGGAAKLKMSVIPSGGYSKEISKLESQLQEAIRQQKSNKSNEKTNNYMDDVEKSRQLGETVKSAEEQLMNAYAKQGM